MKNRKIKFKLFDKNTKKEIKAAFGGDICVGEHVVLVRDFKPGKVGYVFDKIRTFLIEDIIVLEYTGLIDANGVEIYEGYIMSGNGKNKWVVKYEEGQFIGVPIKDNVQIYQHTMRPSTLPYSAVFGIICENQELLK